MRLGLLASMVETIEAGTKAPSASPMSPRMTSRLARPVARPLVATRSEKITTAGTSTFLRPIWSDRRPVKIEDSPQVNASTAEIRPMSW